MVTDDMNNNADEIIIDDGFGGTIPVPKSSIVTPKTRKTPVKRNSNTPIKNANAKATDTTPKKPTRKTTTTPKTPKKTAKPKKACNCPLCGNNFNPADGVNASEHLAIGVLQVFSEMQTKPELEVYTKNPLPCPRCGKYRMSDKVTRNAISRHAKIYVCDICGTEESVLEYANDVLPLPEWWVVREILNRKT